MTQGTKLEDTSLRVLHVAETYPPDYGGGAALYVRDVAEYLARRHHVVTVFCVEGTSAPAYSVRRERLAGVEVVRINLPYFKTADPEGWQLVSAEWRTHESRVSASLGELLGELRPDVVNYHTARPLGEGVLLDLYRCRIPVVAMAHDFWLLCARVMLLRSPTRTACDGPSLQCLPCMYSEYDGPPGLAILKLPWRAARLRSYRVHRLVRRRKARRGLSGVFAYSRFAADVFRRHVSAPVEYGALGLNLSRLPAHRDRGADMRLRFGFIAGFQPTKGIFDVLDAFAALRRSGLEAFRLEVHGPPGVEAQREIDKRGLSKHVALHGLYNPESVFDVFARFDVAIMATLVSEPFGRVPLEAAAVGVPCVAPAIGGIVESIRDGIDGLLYRFRDPADLERKLRRVLAEPDLVGHLAANLRPVPDTRTEAALVERFLLSVVERGRAGR